MQHNNLIFDFIPQIYPPAVLNDVNTLIINVIG